jgi:phage shock protein C
MAEGRLTRSRDDRMIAGVCGGVGSYFDIDPTLVRIGWVVAVALFGTGLLFYILLWILLPESDEAWSSTRPAVQIAEERYARGEIDAEELARIKKDLSR